MCGQQACGRHARNRLALQLHGATTGRVMGSPGYAHKDVLSGQYSEATEGYAVGVTLLVVLTNRDPVDIEDKIEEDHDDKADQAGDRGPG